MIVCHCEAVSDRSIRNTIREGAASVAEIGMRCGAGTGCGGCHDAIEDILDEERCALGASVVFVPLTEVLTSA